MKSYGLVAVPRKHVSDRILKLAIAIFGNSATTRFPLRQILFRELTAREQMEYVQKG